MFRRFATLFVVVDKTPVSQSFKRTGLTGRLVSNHFSGRNPAFPVRSLFTGRHSKPEGTKTQWRTNIGERFYSSCDGNDSADDMHKTRLKVEKRADDEQAWKTYKAKYLQMSLKEKRKHYKCKKFSSVSDVETWPEYYRNNEERLQKLTQKLLSKSKFAEIADRPMIDDELNQKISLWRGDITSLEIDAITNAANSSLLGGGGVDGAIHRAAGKMLVSECSTLGGCDTGDAKISGAYKLPAKYVIHTVGPRDTDEALLQSCYENTLRLLLENNLRTVAIPCISTGIYGFPNRSAAKIALKTARDFLEKNRDKVDRVVFCLFLTKDVEIYDFYAQQYFPVSPPGVTTEVTGGGGASHEDAHTDDGCKPGKTPSDDGDQKSQKKSRVEPDSQKESESEESRDLSASPQSVASASPEKSRSPGSGAETSPQTAKSEGSSSPRDEQSPAEPQSGSPAADESNQEKKSSRL